MLRYANAAAFTTWIQYAEKSVGGNLLKFGWAKFADSFNRVQLSEEMEEQ
jgi:hypothetical protein